MSHAAYIAVLLLLVLSACSPCRRAQGHLARAVRMCPEMAQLRTDTLRTTLPGDTAQGGPAYAAADMDSVLAACAQLHEALLAERELHRVSLDAASRVVLRTKAQVDSLKAVLATRRRALDRMRAELCAFPSVLDSTATRRLRIWYTPAGVRYDLQLYPRTVVQPHTVPQVIAGPVITLRKAPWWLWCWAIGASLLGGWFYLRSDHFRYHYERLKR